MKIDCISDLHGYYPKLEGGDLLIVAGDLTARDGGSEYATFVMWIAEQNYRCKIVIAGNHDNMIQKGKYHLHGRSQNGHPQDELYYLQDSGTEFEGLKIWGSPWTKTFPGMNPHCKAFTKDTDEELAVKWMLIPKDTDILITHSPSFGNFDYTTQKESVGSLSLWLVSLVVKPKLHVFGHIHEAYGNAIHHNGMQLVNCSHVNEYYKPVNKPIRITM